MAAGVSCAERRAELPSRGRPLGERILSTAFLLRDGIGEKELEAAKQSYAAASDNALTSDDAIADMHLDDLFLGRTLAFTQQLNDAIAKLEPDDVNAALQRHVKMERFVPVVAGDLKKAGHAKAR